LFEEEKGIEKFELTLPKKNFMVPRSVKGFKKISFMNQEEKPTNKVKTPQDIIIEEK